MRRIIAFGNQKGGVGKSTGAINIAAILGAKGYKVLVIDLDPQGNSSIGLDIAENVDLLEDFNTVYECIAEDLPLTAAIYQTKFKGVDIVPSGLKLANAELELASAIGRESILRECIENSSEDLDYDFMLLDLPPNMGLLSTNGLVAAGELIIPVDSVFAVNGIRQLVNFMNKIRKKLNPGLDILGVVISNVDCRTNIAKDVYSEVHDSFKGKVFENVIRHNIKIQESQKLRKPVIYYDQKCIGTEDYIALAGEVLKRGGNEL